MKDRKANKAEVIIVDLLNCTLNGNTSTQKTEWEGEVAHWRKDSSVRCLIQKLIIRIVFILVSFYGSRPMMVIILFFCCAN